MAGFTPGPWRVVEDEDVYFCTIRAAAGDQGWIYEEICESVTASNAALIAAAPDLYRALSELIDFLPTEAEVLDSASLNEGQADPFSVAAIKCRKALMKVNGEEVPA